MYDESDYDSVYEILILYNNPVTCIRQNYDVVRVDKVLSYYVNELSFKLINLFSNNQYDGNNIFKTKRIQ